MQLTYIDLLFTYIHLWNFQTLFFQVALQTLCWLEHAGRTDRHVTNTELKLGNSKTVPMFEHWDLKTYRECTLNYRHSPSRHEMKGTTSLTGPLYPRESPRYLLHRWQGGFESCSGQSRAKKQGLSLAGIELCHPARSKSLNYFYNFWKNVQ